jgi:NifU-like protein involved in Fe-S cluster formation
MYSEQLTALFQSRAHAGRLDDATHYGEAGVPGQGPYIRLWVTMEGDLVHAARFKTYGCPASIACAEALCREVEGKLLPEIGEIDAARITELVGGVPEEKVHCPPLAAEAWRSLRAL